MKKIAGYLLASCDMLAMTWFAEELTYAQVTGEEMCLIDINCSVIYLLSKVTINYPVSGNDI